jgi:UDP-2,4-diacetamido-2,4,6-trideoxy-beta-L-altropyranose hydrolase
MSSGRTALFRCDASWIIGGGHVSRSLALAEELARRGWKCVFATLRSSSTTSPALAAAGFPLLELTEAAEQDEAGTIGSRLEHPVDLLIVDHYRRDAVFERECRDWAARIMVIDDLADRPHDADFLLDQTFGRSTADYAALAPADCTMLLGSQYALLRPAFAQLRPLAMRRRNGSLERVLVCMGGADPHDLTTRALDALSLWRPSLAVDVVIGSGYSAEGAIRDKLASFGAGSRIFVATQDMARLIAEADLSVGSGGVITWERCTLGLPACVVVTADNQRGVVRALVEAGAILDAGDWTSATPETIAQVLASQISAQALGRMSEIAASICDGGGCGRVADAIEDRLAGRMA